MPQCERATRSVPFGRSAGIQGETSPQPTWESFPELAARAGFRLGEENSHLV